MLQEGAGLRGQQLENFLTLSQGKLEYEAVRGALIKIDTRRSESLRDRKGPPTLVSEEVGGTEHYWEDEEPPPQKDFSDMSDDQAERALQMLDSQNLREDEVPEALDTLYQGRQRTYRASQQPQAARRKDRGFFDSTSGRPGGDKAPPPPFPREGGAEKAAADGGGAHPEVQVRQVWSKGALGS